MKNTDPLIVVEETYASTISKVWNALTQHQEMIQWYFDNLPAFETRVGFKTQFALQNEGRTFTHLWEVTEVIPNKRITYNWQFQEYAGYSISTFEVIPLEEAVMVRVIVSVLEDFPDGIPEFEAESCRMGWEYFLGLRLKEYLGN